MPKKVKKISDEIEVRDDDVIEGEEKEVDELDLLKSELGQGEYKISVFKETADRTSWEKIKTFSADQFNPDAIAEQYGGGKYRFRVLDEAGRFVKQFTTAYAKPLPVEKPKEATDTTRLEIMEFLKTELASRDQLLGKIIEVVNRPQTNVPVPTMSEILNALAVFQKLTPQPQTEKTNYNELLNGVKTILEISKEISPKNEGSEPADVGSIIQSKVVETLLPKVLNLFAGSSNAQKTFPQTSLPSPLSGGQPSPLNPPNVPPPSLPKEERKMNFVSDFEKNLIEVLEKEKNNILTIIPMNFPVSSIVEYLNSVIDLSELQIYLNIYSIGRIITFIPEFAQHKTFFEVIEKEVKALEFDYSPEDTNSEQLNPLTERNDKPDENNS